MARVVVGLFLIAHGLIHLLYATPRPADDGSYPFVPESRWFPRALDLEVGTARAIARVLAILAVIGFVVTGIALLANAEVWEPLAVVASVISLALLLLFFHPWLLIGIAIDVAIIASVLWFHVPATLFES